jgi:hypothetical protein
LAAIARGHACLLDVPSKRIAAVAMASTASLAALWVWMATWGPRRVQETPIEEFSRRHPWTPALGEPEFLWVGVAAVALVVIARLIAGRRSFVHTLATLSAATFLLFGLWLPVASRLWCSAMKRWSHYLDADFQLAHPVALLAWIVVPPLAGAAIATHFEARLSRRVIRIGIAVGFACGVASRYGAEVATTRCVGQMPAVDCPSLVYVSFVHVVCACAFVACGSPLALAITRHARPDLARACKRYLALLVIVMIPNLIAIDQSFGLVKHFDHRLAYWMYR